MNIASYLIAYPWLLILAFLLLFFLHLSINHIHGALPWNCPLLGMTPFMLRHIFHNFHTVITQILEKTGGTFLFKGIWFTNTDFLATTNPDNVRHIMNKTSIYIKGPEWRQQFDVFGQHPMFNLDFEPWKNQRRIFHSFILHEKFHQCIVKVIPSQVENELIPLLDHVVEHDLVVDLQDLIARHSFCFASVIAFGHNPEALSTGFPKVPFSEALDDAWEAAFYRYLLPKRVWKMQRLFNIGSEKRLCHAKFILDDVIAKHISTQRQKLNEQISDDDSFSFLKCYLIEHEVTGPKPSDEIIKDNLLNLFFATKDTTSSALAWFFYILSKNPISLKKIREELKTVLALPQNHDGKLRFPLSLDGMNKLTFLHAALLESLRLFPPAPFESRMSERSDTLPSGHRVYDKMRVLVCSYAMGRMSSVWGEDCHEFKPERWITEEGKIKRESPHKFFSFASGPRICLGKDVAFAFMKVTVASMILGYNVEVLPGQKVTPKKSLILQMKNGLMVRIRKNV